MKVICQKCSASYDIENQRIPAEGMTMKCPKCLGSFQVQRPDQGTAAPGAEIAGNDTKYFIRRHTGSVFGPFAQSVILTMATDSKLDGSEDLSPDKVDWTRIADHAAFGHIFGDSTMADLPAPAANQAPKLGVPKAAPTPDASHQPADLPAPVPVQNTKPAITPPPPEIPDLPAPKAQAPGPAVRRPTGLGKPPSLPPKAPEIPDLPAPKAQAPGPTALRPTGLGKPPSPTPKAPEIPDLPAPKVQAPGPAVRRPTGLGKPPSLPPKVPEMPDLPTPMVTANVGSAPDLPVPRPPSDASLTPAAPPSGGMPDLPAPIRAREPSGGLAGLLDLPTPKGAPGPTVQRQPDLPTPKGGPTPDGAQQQPDLPTPRGDAPGDDTGMTYGEVDLPVPFEDDMAGIDGGAPLDLSELDLVAPKVDGTSAKPAPDLSELDLVAPKVDGTSAKPAPAHDDELGDVADLLEPASAAAPSSKGTPARAKPGSKATTTSGDRLLGLPKKLAIGIFVGVALVAAVGAAYFLVGRGNKGAPKDETANTNSNTAPVQPQRPGKTRVAYAPAMDLDTHKGYLAADKTYRKQFKKTASNSLKAARAKARLCDAYRYGIKGKRLAKAIKLLAAGDAGDVEWRKAKGLRYLLRKQLKKARGQLKKARAKAKKDPEVYVFLGWVELAAGRTVRAEKAFRRAIKYRGESAAALFGLAQSLAAHRDPTKVAERQKLLSKVIKLSPRHAEARVALLAGRPVKSATAGIKVLTELSASLGDGAAPRERATLAQGLGLLHRRAGQLDRALVLLGRASKLAPLQVQILLSEGEALLEAGDGERAAKRLEAALKIAPHNDRLLEGLVRAHIARGQPLAAKDAILDFTERQPKSSKGIKDQPKKKVQKKRGQKRKTPPSDDAPKPGEVRTAGPRSSYQSLARGRTALALGKTAEAKNLFLESTAEASRFTPGHVAYLALMLQGGQLEGMKSVLELIKRKYRDSLPSDLRDMEGQLLLARSKPARAQKVFRAALESEPHNNRILIHLALCLWQHQNQPEEAYQLLQTIYKRAKSLTRVVSLLADYHWKSGDKERAFGRFKAALKVNRSLSLRRRYAEFLLRAPNPVRLARAEKLLGPILKTNSLDHGATALFALVELGQGRHKKAMIRIKRALTRSPQNLSYLVIKARIAEAGGHANDALSIYESLLVKQPKQRRIMLFRARLLCRNRITKRCLKAAKAILKLWNAPEGYLLQGLGYLQKRKPGRAMRAFKKAIAKNQHYAEAHFLLGRTRYNDAAYRKALTSLIRCLELAEETARWWPDIHYFLGLSYFKVRNKRMAGKHLKKYLSTKGNPDNVETSEQRRTAKSTIKKL